MFWRVAGLVCLLSMFVASAIARPDLNAFLNQKATTTAQLVAQAKRDPEVMDRYMRHYGMSREEVIAFLSSLHPDKIRETGIYTVYSVPEGGRIKMHLQRLKAGELVFAKPSGEPELLLKCGNPLTLGPKQLLAYNKTPVTDVFSITEEQPVEIVTEVDTEVLPVSELQPVSPVYTFPEIEQNPIPLPPIPLGFNPLPLALGGLLFVDNGGNGGPPPPPPPPVPEPASIAAMGLGLAYIGWRKKRKIA